MTATDSFSVWVAHPSAELYGADRMLLESVRAMRARGWRVTVALPTTGPLSALLAMTGAEVRVVEVPVLRRRLLRVGAVALLVAAYLRLLPQLVGMLRGAAPDVVYVSTVITPLWLLAARVARRPLVCHVHELETAAHVAVRRGLLAPLLLAQEVVANSAATEAALLADLRRLGGRTRVIYNGVAGPPAPVPPRQELSGPLRLVVIGRVSPRKGTDVAVAALALLVEQGCDAHLTIVGGTFPGYEDFRDEVKRQVVSSGLSRRVVWAGEVPAPWPALAAADIALVPSREEPFGNTAVEALLAERPVVVSAVQGLAEVISDQNGHSVPPGDAQALATSVQDLACNWPAARDRARRAAGEAESRFSTARYHRELIEAVARVARPQGALEVSPVHAT